MTEGSRVEFTPQQTTTETHEETREHCYWKREQRTQQVFIPRGSSEQNCSDEHRQVVSPRRVQEERDSGYHAVPFTLTVWGAAWREWSPFHQVRRTMSEENPLVTS
ncbi:hypothetical protein AOLI_G00216300 [Acnodon oligacanthus]